MDILKHVCGSELSCSRVDLEAAASPGSVAGTERSVRGLVFLVLLDMVLVLVLVPDRYRAISVADGKKRNGWAEFSVPRCVLDSMDLSRTKSISRVGTFLTCKRQRC